MGNVIFVISPDETLVDKEQSHRELMSGETESKIVAV
jgi:hypothetical protein